MNDPIRASYTLEEISSKLTEWMIAEYGNPRKLKGRQKDRWYEREGAIHHFLMSYFPDAQGNTFKDLP